MAGHYLRTRLSGAYAARRIAGFSGLLLIATVLVFRFGGIAFDVFLLLAEIVAGLIILALLLASVALVRVWRRGHEGGGAALAGLFLALLAALPFAAAGALAWRNPAVASAATDGMQPAEAPAATPQRADGSRLGGRSFEARASQVYAATRLVLDDLGWAVEEVAVGEPEAGEAAPPRIPVPTFREDAEAEGEPDPLDQPESSSYEIAALARDPVLALPSDVSIRIVEDGSGAFVDLSSASRFGRLDLGQNRRFIEAFLTRLDTAMLGAVAPKGS